MVIGGRINGTINLVDHIYGGEQLSKREESRQKHSAWIHGWEFGRQYKLANKRLDFSNPFDKKD